MNTLHIAHFQWGFSLAKSNTANPIILSHFFAHFAEPSHYVDFQYFFLTEFICPNVFLR